MKTITSKANLNDANSQTSISQSFNTEDSELNSREKSLVEKKTKRHIQKIVETAKRQARIEVENLKGGCKLQKFKKNSSMDDMDRMRKYNLPKKFCVQKSRNETFNNQKQSVKTVMNGKYRRNQGKF